MALVKVMVRCAKREDFKGFWAVQRFWPEGDSVADVEEEKLPELRASRYVSVVAEGELEVEKAMGRQQVAPPAPAPVLPPPPAPVVVAGGEMAPPPGAPGSPAQPLGKKKGQLQLDKE